MSITLTDELEVRLKEDRDRDAAIDGIRRGLASAERGELVPAEELFAELISLASNSE